MDNLFLFCALEVRQCTSLLFIDAINAAERKYVLLISNYLVQWLKSVHGVLDRKKRMKKREQGCNLVPAGTTVSKIQERNASNWLFLLSPPLPICLLTPSTGGLAFAVSGGLQMRAVSLFSRVF